jgi:trk system potassium uptake protein TrkH
MMYVILFLTGGFLISHIESLSVAYLLDETASAIGTVGLTLGITPNLGIASQIILIVLMYIGRVGGLTLIFSALSGNQGNTARLPQEKITVG